MSDVDRWDSLEATRGRWEERGAPRPVGFTALMSILRTSIVVTSQVDSVLKSVGLSRTGYLLMITLQLAPDATRPLGQLGKALLVHPTTVTTAVDQLEKSGLIERRGHPSDRRTILARLTDAGQAAVDAATAALADANFGLVGVSDDTAERLITDLGEVRTTLGDVR